MQVRIAGVALDQAGQHVLLLAPLDGDPRVLPIWIGELEATSILVAVEGATVPRPFAHDLMLTLLASLDARVERVEVTRLDGGTYYAEITVTGADGIRRIDARPSDAIALAARAGADIFVADDVLEEAGVRDLIPADPETEPDAEENLDAFRRFLDDVDPDDFRE